LPVAPNDAPKIGIKNVRYAIGNNMIVVENLDLLRTVVSVADIAGEHRDITNSQPEKTLSLLVNT
tara:strand:- start:947 stop:1141 length:195 start_codon:yes stop_codon:yes gene_type:complete